MNKGNTTRSTLRHLLPPVDGRLPIMTYGASYRQSNDREIGDCSGASNTIDDNI